MRILFVILSLFSHLAFAELPTYELKGKFVYDNPKRPVSFLITWSEDDGRIINGRYRDDYFISDGALVTGAAQPLGRDFLVRFPTTIKGVRTISMLSTQFKTKEAPKVVPVTIITRGPTGNPREISDVTATFALATPDPVKETALVVQREEEAPRPQDPCVEHFGVLAGFCGVYQGLLSEELDPENKCDLGNNVQVRLELEESGNVTLYLPADEKAGKAPRHNIGRITANPSNRSIDILNRNCNDLLGVDLNEKACKRINLQGTFSAGTGSPSFLGTYLIIEEATGIHCKYSLSLGKE